MTIFDDAFNHSDHCPVTCQLQFDLSTVNSTNRCTKDLSKNELRWDKSNLSDYFALSELLLKSLKIPWFLFNNNLSDNLIKFGINKFYNDIVDGLTIAADRCITKKKKDFFKYWWDEEIEILKKKAIDSFNLWKELSKQRQGS